MLIMLVLPAALMALLVQGGHASSSISQYDSVATSTGLDQYVNVFLGTENGGNMFPGVVPAPFSVVKLGPDVTDGTTDAYSGYLDAGNITGFSMTHESGTGGSPKYGVVSQMPSIGNISNPLVNVTTGRLTADTGSVGYYKSQLSNGITVELAGTNHAGLYQYSFPQSSVGPNNVVVDVSHFLTSYRGLGWQQQYAGGNFSVASDGHYEGSGTYAYGWNLAPNWTIHFCGYFEQDLQSWKTFSGDADTLLEYGSDNTTYGGSYRQGGVFSFSSSNVTSRVGISWISSAKACTYVNTEIPSNTSLSTLVSNSVTTWSDQVFNKVQTTSTNTTMLQMLYSYLYGMHILPTNRTGDNPLWESSEPYYDDIFTLWDLFRCGTALMQVLQPVSYEEQIRSLIDIWRHVGWMPDARSSDSNGETQGGSNADTVLADAYVKGVRGAVNWTDGYGAMKADAEITPPNNHDPRAPDSSTVQGRGALPDWLEYGYLTPRFSRAVSRACEYAGNDFGLHQVATGLGLAEDAELYLNRSRNWRNHWNPLQESLGFYGFVVPRYANGSFEYPYDPLQCGSCYWEAPYYEATPWEYSFTILHDMTTLIDYAGSNETFIDKLSTIFKNNASGSGGTIFDVGNEPDFGSPYLFSWAGRQDLSVATARPIGYNNYGAGVDGLPGNSDAGAMQTWILWQMIGLYPITGQTTFLIGSPWFEDLSIDLGNNNTLTITSTGGSLVTAPYVQSLEVNGEAWDKSWVTWSDIFENGGTLAFVLGENATQWDTGALPPSPAS